MPVRKPQPKPILLNEEQQAVVGARNGVFAVYAGPGSGKTATCVKRIAALIQEGVDPNTLLSLSFTATAAKNLRTRVEELVGKLSINRTAGCMTLHSLALKFAEEERNAFSYNLAEFPLATEPVALKLSGAAARRFDIDPRALRPVVSLYKRNRIRASQAIRDAESNLDAKKLKLALAYKEYEKQLTENGVLDFDSLMFEMVDILDKKPGVRARWQYQYVICDESQDCCKTDWELLRLLSEKHGNLACVGDPGQSIFGFRGASCHQFLNMQEMFPTVQKLFLAANYRSTPELVNFLKEVGPVPELAEKFHTSNASGPTPQIKGFTSPIEEANWVVSQLKEASNVLETNET